MKSDLLSSHGLAKCPTGVVGLDRLTRGGLPKGSTTVIAGGPGCGKTVLSLQTLAHGAQVLEEPGIFVAFEEFSSRILANARPFGWNLEALRKEDLFFLDAQPDHGSFVSGDFDLGGLLAALGAKAQELGAKRIVFDALDTTLSLLDSEKAIRREVYRLHDWLSSTGMTAVITAKTDRGAEISLDFLHYMVDCVIELRHTVLDGYSQRSLRVLKYRGSSFSENECPFLISSKGFQVAHLGGASREVEASTERVSSGVEQLDTMLGGGYFRGTSVLITGVPGTAKTTLAGAFAQAACERGERTAFVSFDSTSGELERNLASVGFHLAQYSQSGMLTTMAARAIDCSAEFHLLDIKGVVEEHGSRCLVVDPISALCKGGLGSLSHSVAERLIDWCKSQGITLVCTSLLDLSEPTNQSTPLQVSTIADTWIHLTYQVHAGERNRALSIVKSRGTAHSNQVREVILTSRGVSLTEVYTSGGEVLMGTLRLERERREHLESSFREAEAAQRQRLLDAEMASLQSQIELLEQQKQAKLELKSSIAHALNQADQERASTAREIQLKREKVERGAQTSDA